MRTIACMLSGILLALGAGSADPQQLEVRVVDNLVTLRARDVPAEEIVAEITRVADLDRLPACVPDQRMTLQIERRPVLEVLRRVLGDPEWTSERAATATLALRDSDAELRAEAAIELATSRSQRASAVLAEAAVRDPDVTVREESVLALGLVGGDLALPALEQALMDPREDVRRAAVEALTGIGTEEAADILAFALTDRSASLREDAVYALGDIGCTSALRALQPALDDEDESVRDAAAEVIAELERDETRKR